MAASVYTHSLAISAEDIDRQGHVNNVAFVRYVQETAVAHWQSLVPAEIQSAYTWVVRRHEIEYLKPGLPGDALAARTWVGEPSGASWERFTEIVRGDGTLLVKARTVWVLLDAVSLRPRRVEKQFVELLSEDRRDSA